jgi:hypothetical protein
VQRKRNRVAIQRRKARIAAGKKPGRRNLGPMGELGDDIIISVELTTNYQKFMESMKRITGRRLRIKDLDTPAEVYRSVWGNVYFPLQQHVTTEINSNVPKATTDLVDSMKKSIKVPLGGSFPLIMILNTAGIDYAKPVNRMPDTWLKHPTAVHSNTRKIKGRLVILVDPQARRGWYDITLLNGRNRARRLWSEYIKKTWVPLLKGVVKNPTNEVKKMFRVKFR